MLVQLWDTLLYIPLLNALIYLYNTIAGQNLGWAVVWLTVALRIILLPFTIISIRGAGKEKKLEEAAAEAVQIYKNDPVAQKEEMRRIMKQHHISPWARTLTLVVQAIVFIVLYQVFIHGITGEKIMKNLYASVDFPGKLYTQFFGFELGKVHDTIWASIVGGYLFISILVQNLKRPRWQKSDLYFLIFFPVFVGITLWFLPMVKSLFILTTAIFSDIVTLILKTLLPEKKKDESASSAHH
jgi:YidC/Oxa1 family membrane protein insertase